MLVCQVRPVAEVEYDGRRMLVNHQIISNTKQSYHVLTKCSLRSLQVSSNQPGVQFYTGNFLPRLSILCFIIPLSLTPSPIHSCLVDLIDVTLACEDANSKLVDIVTVADVDDEDHVGNSLLQI